MIKQVTGPDRVRAKQLNERLSYSYIASLWHPHEYENSIKYTDTKNAYTDCRDMLAAEINSGKIESDVSDTMQFTHAKLVNLDSIRKQAIADKEKIARIIPYISRKTFRDWCNANNIQSSELSPVLRLWTFGDDTPPENAETLEQSPYWRELRLRLCKAIESYPAWKKGEMNGHVPDRTKLSEWYAGLVNGDVPTTAELRVMAKVMSDTFPELDK